MKRFWWICAAALIVLTGCQGTADISEDSSQPTEIVVSDVIDLTSEPMLFPIEICGTEIPHEAKRVVSLSPAVTEIIAELGYADRLCGISKYCDYPEELSVQAVGSAENPDIEIITALAPDVLFTISELSERDMYAIEECGTAVVVLKTPSSVEGYGQLYSNIAAAFVGDEASVGIGNDAALTLKAAASNVNLTSFVYVTGKKTAAGAGTIENELLSIGSENVCKQDGYAELAAIADASPEYIIASDELTYEDIVYDDILAVFVYNGAEIVFVDSTGFERPSARTCDIFSQIGEQLLGYAAE